MNILNSKKLVDYKIHWLVIIYLTITFAKIILSFQIPTPFIFFDETVYSKMAQSFIESGKFFVLDKPSSQYPPLYPIILSTAYLLSKDIVITYPAMKIINSFLSSLIVFPVWLIAKEFLSAKKSVITATLSALLPASFAYTFTIMSENLFYPLFMLSLFFMMKSLTKDNRKWDILCGLAIGLSILSRMIGMVLLVVLVLGLLIKGIARTIISKNTMHSYSENLIKIIMTVAEKWHVFLLAVVLITPWLLRNAYYFGFTTTGLIGGYQIIANVAEIITGPRQSFSLVAFVYWGMMHIGYFVLATGIIFFALSVVLTWRTWKQELWSEGKNTNLLAFMTISWASLIVLVLICAYWTYWGHRYLMGRYINPILPAFLIMGAIGLDSYDKREHKSLFGVLIVCSVLLAFIPINYLIRAFNTPDAYILLVPQYIHEMGILPIKPSVVGIKLLLMALPFVFLIFIKKNALKWRYVAPTLLVFFIVTSTVAFGVMYTASHDAQDEMEIGLWLHFNAPERSVVLFDEQDVNQTFWVRQGVLFWTNDDIRIDDTKLDISSADYVLSLHQIDLPLCLEVNVTTSVIKSSDNIYYLYHCDT